MKEKVFGILGAMQSEVEHLRSVMEGAEEHSAFGLPVWTGRLSGQRVALVQCGIGKVLSARSAQLLIDLFGANFLINTGIAGGIGEGLSIGDAVVASDLVQHDYDLRPMGRVLGNLADSPNMDVPTSLAPAPQDVEALRLAAESLLGPSHVHVGRIVSGDQFIAGREKRLELRATFHALAAEMEGAAVAQVAIACGLPFVVIRILSDLADGGAPASFEEFEQKTADIAAKVTLEFLKR